MSKSKAVGVLSPQRSLFIYRSWMVVALVTLPWLGLSAQPTPQAIARADKLVQPEFGVLSFELEGEEFLGTSKRGLGALIFRVSGNSDGIGGDPQVDLVAIDPENGAELERVAIEPQIIPDEDEGPAAKRQLSQRIAAMKAAGRDFLAKWKPISETFGQTFTGWAANLSDPSGETSFGGEPATWRLYVGEARSAWYKPLAEHSAVTPVSFEATAYLTAVHQVLVRFTRPPVMEYDRVHSLYVLVSWPVWSQFLNEVGFQEYNLKHYAAAIDWFEQSGRFDASAATPRYNAACTAALMKEPQLALSHLRLLRALGTAEAWQYLCQVATDHDFDAVRSNTAFSEGLKAILKR